MTDGEQIQTALSGAEQARVEQRKFGERIALLDQQVDESARQVSAAREALVDETADVEKLESFSPTRILAELKGDRVERLEREKAEQHAAEYAVATAEARLAQMVAERDNLRGRRDALGEVDATWEQALAAKERWLVTVDPDKGAAVSELAARIGGLQAEAKELSEAIDAHGRAVLELEGVAEFLGSARSWSTYDAWFGGGMIADMAKHQKLDEASARMRSADTALKALGAELADVDVQPIGELGITDLTRTLDLWFDNMFSDFAVRDRIVAAIERVETTLGALHSIGGQLRQQRDDVATALTRRVAEREEVLRA
ncbi:MAG: hypothetical protein L0H93_18285 [Nocardioides sp.]|nr:hypothetical protein [Nocardioides sp.]